MALVEDVAARLRAQVTSRTVYEHAVPDGVVAAAYLLVRAAVTDEGSERMSTTTHTTSAAVRVRSVAEVDPELEGWLRQAYDRAG